MSYWVSETLQCHLMQQMTVTYYYIPQKKIVSQESLMMKILPKTVSDSI